METQEIIDFIEEVKKNLSQEGKENHPFKVLEAVLTIDNGMVKISDSNHPDNSRITFRPELIIYPTNLKSSQKPVLIAVEDTFKNTLSSVIKTLGHPTTMNEVAQIIRIPDVDLQDQPFYFF